MSVNFPRRINFAQPNFQGQNNQISFQNQNRQPENLISFSQENNNVSYQGSIPSMDELNKLNGDIPSLDSQQNSQGGLMNTFINLFRPSRNQAPQGGMQQGPQGGNQGFSQQGPQGPQGYGQQGPQGAQGGYGMQGPQGPQNQDSLNPFAQSQPTDPDTFAQTYADSNGITLDEAKAELKELYGDPQEPQAQGVQGPQNSQQAPQGGMQQGPQGGNQGFSQQGPQGPQGYGQQGPQGAQGGYGMQGPQNQGTNPFSAQQQDPDTYAQSYADANGITLDEAKAELKAKYGDPQKIENTQQAPNCSTAPDISKEETSIDKNETEAEVDKIDADKKDPEALVKEYADEHNISIEEAKKELIKLYGEANLK